MSSEKELASSLLNEYVHQQENLKARIEQLSAEINITKDNLDKCTLLIDLLNKEINPPKIENNYSNIHYRVPQPYMTDIMYDFLKEQRKACVLKDIVEHVSNSSRGHARSGYGCVYQCFHCLYGRLFIQTGLAWDGRRDCPSFFAYGIPEFAIFEEYQRD